MGYGTVRASVAAWISPPNVPGVRVVYPAMPKLVNAQAFGIWPVSTYNLGTQQAGCFAFLHVDDTRETRIAIGGAHSGIKAVEYSIGIVFPFLALTQPGDTDDGSYIGAWDTIVDNLKERFRADRTLSQDGNVIFQAGEGADDLHIASDLPHQDQAGNVYIWSVLQIQILELVDT